MKGPRSEPVRIPSSLDTLIAYRLSSVGEQEKRKYAPIIFGDGHPDIQSHYFKGEGDVFAAP